MTKKTKENIVYSKLHNREFVLPEGIRLVDIKLLEAEEMDIINDLVCHGRRTRYYYSNHDLMTYVKRLKSRGFIEAVKLGNNYAYDLSAGARMLVRNALL